MSNWLSDLEQFFPPLTLGVGLTVTISVGSFVLGALIAIPLALARVSGVRAVRWPSTAYVELLRGVPPLAWLFLIYFGLASRVITLGRVSAVVLALGLVAGAYLAEIYRAGILSVAHGQWEAGRAVGLQPVGLYVRIILPQAVVVVIPPSASYAIALLKDSSLAAVIGAQEITFRAFVETQRTLHGLEVFSVAAILYLLLSVPLAALSRWLDAGLRSYMRL